MIAGVVLAAGYSRRAGFNKLEASLCGKPLLEWPLSALIASEVAGVKAVVVGPRTLDTLRLVSDDLLGEIIIIYNPRPWEGLSSSLRASTRILSGLAKALVFLHGDMPFVSPTTIRSVAEKLEEGYDLVFTVHGGWAGPPAGISSSAFKAVSELRGDSGLKSIASGLRVGYVEASSGLEGLDVDTLEDLERAGKYCSSLAGRH